MYVKITSTGDIMSNKYLEKIAGVYSGVIKPVASIATSAIKMVGKDIGNSVHSAMGGAFKDEAVAKGFTNQNKLRSITNSDSFQKATNQSIKSGKLDELQGDKNKGIIKTIGYGTAGIVGTNKLLNHIQERRQQKEYYQ